MRFSIWAVFALLLSHSAATAQISVIVVPKEPQEAQELVGRAEKVAKIVKTAQAKGEIPMPARRKVVLAAKKFMAEARSILKSSQLGVPLSYLEEASIKKDLKRVQTVCRWLVKQVNPQSGMPSPAAAIAAATTSAID